VIRTYLVPIHAGVEMRIAANSVLPMRSQSGVMLIEALLAILIFSIGVLGLVSLQAAANKASTQAKYRTEASLLANDLIGRMWVSDRTVGTIVSNFSDPGSCAAAKALADALSPPLSTPANCSLASSSSAYRAWAWEGQGAALGTTIAPSAGTVLQTLPNSVSMQPQVIVTPVQSSLTTTASRVHRSRVTVQIQWQLPGEAQSTYTTQVEIGG
jgi:type IV pilus assembly protein PilV